MLRKSRLPPAARRLARTLAAPGENPRTTSTRASARHSPSLRPGGPPEHAPDAARPALRADDGTSQHALEELAELEVVPDVVLDRLRRGLTARLDDARDRLTESDGATGGQATESADRVYRQLRRDLIAVETGELQRLYDAHTISDTTRRRLQRSLDLEEARLSDA
ncbi:hypothetical protein [Streptomyces alanosinicus]|uniref:Uncharacterized protein n=1 Tax=Streptomyces alanosinicus TaxID=68171 RepID=A0A918YEZ9_9ACTN|nr:hypothetical protein [Streptomyces alanosinicus]GHE00837.1 hypothetical protein GCM10010339_17480 [Streptomyces alanosinicus]